MSTRVLIADDHAVFRSGLRALLEKEPDLEVVGEAADGFEAIKEIEEKDVDVLLLDITMPGIPGPRVAETALERRPRLAIVVLTMHEDEYYLRELLKIGVRGFVVKRSTGRELVQAIRSARQGEEYIDPTLAGRVISGYVSDRPKKGKGGRLELLTPREREVCRLLAFGHTNPEIAETLCISARTVETHRANVMDKLGLRSRAELVRFAIDHGLLKLS